ncbi:hypothetical protein BaRGS_00022170, partial [Batillaria attramentaria]
TDAVDWVRISRSVTVAGPSRYSQVQKVHSLTAWAEVKREKKSRGRRRPVHAADPARRERVRRNVTPPRNHWSAVAAWEGQGEGEWSPGLRDRSCVSPSSHVSSRPGGKKSQHQGGQFVIILYRSILGSAAEKLSNWREDGMALTDYCQ